MDWEKNSEQEQQYAEGERLQNKLKGKESDELWDAWTELFNEPQKHEVWEDAPKVQNELSKNTQFVLKILFWYYPVSMKGVNTLFAGQINPEKLYQALTELEMRRLTRATEGTRGETIWVVTELGGETAAKLGYTRDRPKP